MNANTPDGQAIYNAIARGSIVEVPTGYYNTETHHAYELTSHDYIIRRDVRDNTLARPDVLRGAWEACAMLLPGEKIRSRNRLNLVDLLIPPVLPPGVTARDRYNEECAELRADDDVQWCTRELLTETRPETRAWLEHHLQQAQAILAKRAARP